MEVYYNVVRALEDKLYGLEINHIMRKYYEEANELVKITSGQITVPPNIFSRDLTKPTVNFSKTTHDSRKPSRAPLKTTGTEPMDEDPSNEELEVSNLEGSWADEAEAMEIDRAPSSQDWRSKYLAWIDRGELPSDRIEERHIARKAKSFTMIGRELYKCNASGILQRCIPVPNGRELIRDIQADICSHHATLYTLVGNVLLVFVKLEHYIVQNTFYDKHKFHKDM
jgi:hypothetical protein